MGKARAATSYMEGDIMHIYGEQIPCNAHRIVRLAVGHLPSGNEINIRAHIYRAPVSGPCMLLLGGVHGDEINGVEIVRQIIAAGTFRHLISGSVIAIPVLNIYGLIQFSRDVPDGKDVNRSFPGSPKGSVASRVASVLSQHILPLVDFGVDCHTGGNNNYNYPQIRYTVGEERAKNLAEAFNAPLTLAYKTLPKTLREYARREGTPILVFEGGENLRYDGLSIQTAQAGIQRVLQQEGMLREAPPVADTQHFSKTTWIRAQKAGLFQWMKKSGQPTVKNEPLGFISDPHAIDEPEYILSTKDGFMIGHNNNPVVHQGDALFHLAY